MVKTDSCLHYESKKRKTKPDITFNKTTESMLTPLFVVGRDLENQRFQAS